MKNFISGAPQVLRYSVAKEVEAISGRDVRLEMEVCSDPVPSKTTWEWGQYSVEAGKVFLKRPLRFYEIEHLFLFELDWKYNLAYVCNPNTFTFSGSIQPISCWANGGPSRERRLLHCQISCETGKFTQHLNFWDFKCDNFLFISRPSCFHSVPILTCLWLFETLDGVKEKHFQIDSCSRSALPIRNDTTSTWRIFMGTTSMLCPSPSKVLLNHTS